MENNLNILLLEDSESDADLLLRHLRNTNNSFSYSRVWKKEDFIKSLQGRHPDLILADHTLPQFDGMEAFRLLKTINKDIPFILVTGSVSEKLLAGFAKEGIDDYCLKDNLLRLPSAIDNAIFKKKIEKLHRELEQSQRDIQDSINYAKIIQDSMLPDSRKLSTEFPDSFILNKPKNVLSGDFYWFRKSEELFHLAVADCTGHGIPGAMVSVLGMEKLSDAVIHGTDTSDVLSRLNKGVKRSLHQSDRDKPTRDGMDIAFCSIDKNKGQLKYAGANRPLWIIRKGKSVLEEIKPTKNAIGGFTKDEQQFISHKVELQKGDIFYLFSDGYADTFGGQDDKKLKTKRFKQILLEIRDKSMEEQKEYLNEFVEVWKAGAEQVDDILVIGVRV